MSTIEFEQEVLEEDLRRYYSDENPVPEGIIGRVYTHQEVWRNVENILNAHYGTDYKLKL